MSNTPEVDRNAEIEKRNRVSEIASQLAGYPAPSDKEAGRLADRIGTIVESPRYRGNRKLASMMDDLINAIGDLSMSCDFDGRPSDEAFDNLEGVSSKASSLLFDLRRRAKD